MATLTASVNSLGQSGVSFELPAGSILNRLTAGWSAYLYAVSFPASYLYVNISPRLTADGYAYGLSLAEAGPWLDEGGHGVERTYSRNGAAPYTLPSLTPARASVSVGMYPDWSQGWTNSSAYTAATIEFTPTVLVNPFAAPF